MTPLGNRKKNLVIAVELALIGLAAVVAFFISSRYGVLEGMVAWMARHESWQTDEAFSVGIVLVVGFGFFSARRWLDLRASLKERDRVLDELLAASIKAEGANRAKGEFLANMSHEIRTPMNAIIGMTDLTLDTELDCEQREYLQLVKNSAGSLLQILNDILDFSKIEAGKLDLDSADFKLRDVLGDVGKSLSLRAHEKGLELACHIHPDVPNELIGDPLRLRQIVVNLVGNAIKFTERGEVVMSVERQEDPDHAQPNGAVELHFAVRDTGIGVPPKMQRAIFEAFTQSDGSSTRRFGGTGLGLTISGRLVALMHGKIWVESDLGHGSTFHFTARFDLQKETQAGQTVPPQASLAGLPVLIVDDNSTNRLILKEMLQGWKMRPTCVDSGVGAAAAMVRAFSAREPFALVLLDAMMPGMDGFTVAEQLKADPDLAEATIMMLSSADYGDDAARCRKLGIANYLRKPVAQSDLFNAMVAALAGRASRPAPPRPATPAPAPAAEFPGGALNILLAEDNVIGQRVASSILEKRGHHVSIVGNGREVMQALACERFDVVLMDIQMPEMDGLEATAAIRQAEAATGQHLPIIAMTAHAMKGDRECCLQSGMDDYVSKPVDPETLLSTIFRVLARLRPADDSPPAPIEDRQRGQPAASTPTVCSAPAAEPNSPAGPPAASTADGLEIVDLPALKARVEQDLDLLQEMIGLFLGSSTHLVEQIESAIARNDPMAAGHAAHALKGALQNMCAEPAAEAAHELEKLGPDGDLTRMESALSELKKQLQLLQPVLERVAEEVRG